MDLTALTSLFSLLFLFRKITFPHNIEYHLFILEDFFFSHNICGLDF